MSDWYALTCGGSANVLQLQHRLLVLNGWFAERDPRFGPPEADEQRGLKNFLAALQKAGSGPDRRSHQIFTEDAFGNTELQQLVINLGWAAPNTPLWRFLGDHWDRLADRLLVEDYFRILDWSGEGDGPLTDVWWIRTNKDF